MGAPVPTLDDDAPPLLVQSEVLFIRDRAIRLECEVLAGAHRRAHPGSLPASAASIARELLAHAIRDPVLRRKVTGASTC